VSFQFPVTFDQEILCQYREELEYTNQEVELLAINLERNPNDLSAVEQIRDLIQDSWMSSVKLDLVPISESLADTLKGLDLLLDWQVYPARMTEFVLSLLDRVMVIAREIEEKQFIDIRRTQAILVALQYIILAKDFNQITKGIEDAILAINQEIGIEGDSAMEDADVMLFDDGVDLFDDGVDLFDDATADVVAEPGSGPDIFIPDASLSPLSQAREFINTHSDTECINLLGSAFEHAIEHHRSHTLLLAELALSTNILAGRPIDFELLYKGICLHDIGMVPIADGISRQTGLTKEEKEQLQQHPLKSAEVAEVLNLPEEAELLILHHHERLDGSGFPFGLKGGNICESGKLVAIIDSFHGVMEKNAHRSERDQVLRAIIEVNVKMGKYYDPVWVDYFNRVIRDYWLSDWREERRKALQQVS